MSTTSHGPAAPAAHATPVALPPKPTRKPIPKTMTPIMPTPVGRWLYHASWNVIVIGLLCLIVLGLVSTGFGIVKQKWSAYLNNNAEEIISSKRELQAVFNGGEKVPSAPVQEVKQDAGAPTPVAVGYFRPVAMPVKNFLAASKACDMELEGVNFVGCPTALYVQCLVESTCTTVECNLEEGANARERADGLPEGGISCGIMQIRDVHRVTFDEQHYGMSFDECRADDVCSYRLGLNILKRGGLLKSGITGNEQFRAYPKYGGVVSQEMCYDRARKTKKHLDMLLGYETDYNIDIVCDAEIFPPMEEEKESFTNGGTIE